jgi:hypothetical protein
MDGWTTPQKPAQGASPYQTRQKTIRDKKADGEYLRDTETDVNRLDRTDWIMQKLLSSYSNYDGKFVANLLNF